MATKNVREELKRLDEEEARIRTQREQLKEQAKEEALAAVNAAIEELNALGYSYRLVQGREQTRSAPRQTTGRRSGIRDQVLQTVASAGGDGIAAAAVREKLGMDDKPGTQAVANALAALKRQSKIAQKGGLYIAA